ncbi:MAG: alpha-2-macroglobulin [Chloroflexi bacterium]|nr:alpha-2-macroglobulin [Chloroflexota bacterium]
MKSLTRGVHLLFATLVLLSACVVQPDVRPTTSPDAGPTPGAVSRATDDPVDGYVVLAPRVLRSGQREAVSFSLLRDSRPARTTVRVALLHDGRPAADSFGVVDGKGAVALNVPRLPEGEYQIEVSGKGFKDQAPIRVEDGTLLFVETDKPIYKPGQTIHIRVLTLDPELRPFLAGEVTVEAQDAKGIKVFKKVANTDEFGMATLDLPLSTEPNLGVWKLTGRSGKRTAQVDVRVEEYVLPKYEVKVDLRKDWFLAGERIAGEVGAEYSFGKPVKGEVEIKATRYVGTWQEFARITKQMDGNVSFDLPPAGYVAGVPAAKGMGNVSLEVLVREQSTGYEEKTTRLLTVAASPIVLQIIPETAAFKPGLPLNLLVIAESPDRKPADANVSVRIGYIGKGFQQIKQENHPITVRNGKALLKVTPPQDAIALQMNASSGQSGTSLSLEAGYSPTGSFIHVEQVSQGPLKVGSTPRFKVSATKEAANFYYEVVGRGKVVFSSFSRSPEIGLTLTPLMAPSSRLLVYQILPNSEVAADFVPFTVEGSYPQQVSVAFAKPEVKPGDPVDIDVSTQGPAKVGLAAVDRSVFILAENRLNLQQVFDELERLYLKPQAELHSARILDNVNVRGARDIFQDAGVVVISNKSVPEGVKYESPRKARLGVVAEGARGAPVLAAAPQAASSKSTEDRTQGLAEVQRVRQFFPETWLWQDVRTDQNGKATTRVTAPDSITTWMLRAVALSKENGLGIAEAQLKVFQPFFFQVDLPYSAVRNEEFPVKIALYNYTNARQEFFVDIEKAAWFDLLDQGTKPATVGPNDVGGVTFKIRPRALGTNKLKITARSTSTADAVIKELLVEPEGVPRETVENLILSAGAARNLDVSIPATSVDGSGRVYLTVTGNYLTQTIEGLERLLQMPFGCGEQNMILLAPNVFVTRYLEQTDQLKPEVMAKAEKLMITGYQRELIYRRTDGSFSAFGQQDKEGSLWLTAFVLKTFAQAKELIFVDDAVLDAARAWITRQQKADGSFDPVGFVTHKELLGGLNGKTALTAYVAIALKESGEQAVFAKATAYLESKVAAIDDPYTMAIVTYALELAKSARAKAAYDKLMGMARQSDDGLYWGAEHRIPEPLPQKPGLLMPPQPPQRNQSAAVETTGYATLALLEHGDRPNAARAARWLVSHRNAYGGFGSTQDTVVGLHALIKYAADARSDVDITVALRSGAWSKEVRVTPANSDVLQVVEIPAGNELRIETRGRGQVVAQAVRRFNVPAAEQKELSAFQIKVNYGTDKVAVDDLIDISATIKFTPPVPMEAGMVVLDIAVPTGFAPVHESIASIAKKQPKLKRHDVAGRKVILYIEDMSPNEELSFTFQARALYPVKAQAVTSTAYAYYRPEWRGESLGGEMVAE